MSHALEDELGDILQKARDGKKWSQEDLANAVDVSTWAIARMERYDLMPDEDGVYALAKALNLDGPALWSIANQSWVPEPPRPDPTVNFTCLEVLMGTYPVKCYVLACPETKEAVVVDTGANPEAIIRKVGELKAQVEHILLTHNHPDHSWGLDKLDQAFNCPTWIGSGETKPFGSRDLRYVKDGDVIEVGRLRIDVLSTPGHTADGMSYKVGDTVLSGDCLFAGSMGRANACWQDLYCSIKERLLSLPDHTVLHPGHGPATTVGEEKRHNPFFCNGG